MTKLSEQMRLRKRLVEHAVELAVANQWEDAIATNRQLLQMGDDTEAFNRIGKALLEMGRIQEAQEAYNETLRLNPSNVIARKSITRLSQLASMSDGGVRREERHNADPQLFIVETGKTALTTLTNVWSKDIALRLVPGEAVRLEHDGKEVRVVDAEGRAVGQLEPQLAQRLVMLLDAGNHYQAVIANLDGKQIKVLIREVFTTPEQRNVVSFPGKLGGDINTFRSFQRDLPSRYELDDADLLEEEELATDDAIEPEEEDFFRGSTTGEDEEVGLEELEADIKDDDDEDEES
ncbi:MAG: tetratricopeptide repeat protein [Herpetosiphonaceae bacterium]|nr:tetratricopeptide repeat protein [Herpetosiphonaceae bacterium]